MEITKPYLSETEEKMLVKYKWEGRPLSAFIAKLTKSDDKDDQRLATAWIWWN